MLCILSDLAQDGVMMSGESDAKSYQWTKYRWYGSVESFGRFSMALYRELPAAAQTAYAELQELVQVAETPRSPASLTG